MPYKQKICGVYTITTPNGSVYVGSSYHIHQRWSEHRSDLRRNKHHSDRLQMAWNKHGDNLVFEIVAICRREDLERIEQEFIHKMNACLNTTQYVRNVWCSEITRAKFAKVHSSIEWKKLRSDIAKKIAQKRGIKVDCSDGNTFDNLHRAAEAYGVNPSAIRALITTQRVGKLGVRFKRSSEEWREVISSAEQRYATIVSNNKHRSSMNRKIDKRTSQKGVK